MLWDEWRKQSGVHRPSKQVKSYMLAGPFKA